MSIDEDDEGSALGAETQQSNSKRHQFYIHTHFDTHLLAASSVEERQRWVDVCSVAPAILCGLSGISFHAYIFLSKFFSLTGKPVLIGDIGVVHRGGVRRVSI